MKYIVQGELETILNNKITSVIMQLVCKTKEEAEEVKTERLDRYKKLKIIEVDDV